MLTIISYVLFLKNVESVTKVNSIVIPILILIILIIGTKNIFNIGISNIESNLEKDNSIFWIIESIIYASYNLILLIPVLINISAFIKKRKQIIYISIISRTNNLYYINFNIFIINKCRYRLFKLRNANYLRNKK